MFWYFATSAAQMVTPALREARIPKKRPDKQQNQEEPPVSLGARHMPQPAPVDDEAFARRAGKIIGNSNTSLYKARDARNRRLRRSGRNGAKAAQMTKTNAAGTLSSK